jgi:hypothetical protein
MVSFLTLAFATVASASTFSSAPPPPAYSAPPAVSSSASEPVGLVTITSYTSVIVKGPEPTQPAVVTSFPAVTDTGIMSAVSSTSSGDYINLSSELSRAGNNLTTPTSTISEVPVYMSSVVVAPSNMPTSTVVVTVPASNTTAHPTGSVTATPTPPTVPVSTGGKVQVGVAVGMVALIVGVLGV